MSQNNSDNNNHSPYRSCFRSDLFSSKVSLVTGGGTGIGLAIAQELAQLGATVVSAGRDVSKCQAAVDAWTSSGAAKETTGKIVVGPSTNIRDTDQVAALVAYCVETHGALNFLVNNAGGQFISPASALSKGGFKAVVETNLIGTFLVSQQAYLQYMEEHGGSIVNITLINGNGLPGMSHSAASRAGVENLTKTLALEWMEAGVRVNCVRPGTFLDVVVHVLGFPKLTFSTVFTGIIWTESGFAAYGDAGEEFLEKLLPTIPAKRLGTAEEVSSAVVWLLSQGASYVTGTALCVDGGAGFTFLPLIDIPDQQNLPIYGGKLPRKARL